MSFVTPSPTVVEGLDPNKGMLCVSVYWRPRPSDPDPEMPGEKLSIASYIPVADDDAPCLCGSGQAFRLCCQAKPYWQAICPNPGDPRLKSYSPLQPQAVTFTKVDGYSLGPMFMDDERLQCFENTIKRAFWTYWGDPSLLSPYGTLCFGDIELRNAQTLMITALSNLRMETLLNLLRELAGDSLGTPVIKYDPIKHLPKAKGLKKNKFRKG